MKKLTFLMIWLTVLVFMGCSKAPGKSEAKFKIGIAAITDINAVGAGGAMMWGKSDGGEMFGMAISPSTPLELTLSNGLWTFWSVAWEGSGVGKFTGTVRCSKNTLNLSGADVQVNITLSNANCALLDFGPTVAINNVGLNQFPDISHYECSALSQHNGKGCGPEVGGAKTVSKRLVLQSFKKTKDGPVQVEGPRLASNCYLSGEQFPNEHLPLGDGSFPVLTYLESFYSSANCDEADPKGVKKAVFEWGLMNSARLDTIKFVTEGFCNVSAFTMEDCMAFGGSYSATCSIPTSAAQDIAQLACVAKGGTYVSSATTKQLQLITTIADAEVCSGVRADIAHTSPHPFAAGNGSLSSPYIICKEVQLNTIGQDMANYSSASFMLAADLDMNRTSIMGDQPIPSCLSVDPGENFVPIGGLFNSDCTEAPATAFGGSFNGNGHSIANIRARITGDDLGFIRVGGSISNLTLKNVEFEGNAYVGAISGRGANSLQNLTVIDGDIRGKNNIGGIAGAYSQNTNAISNVHAQDMSIQLDHSSVPANAAGGLVGFADGSGTAYFKKSSFDGIILSQNSGEMLGGIIGKAMSGVNIAIDDSFSAGVVLTSGTASSAAGGLVGYAGSGSVNINASYSRMSIGPSSYRHTLGAANIGGLVGMSGTMAANNSYYYGSIMHPCKDTINNHCSFLGALKGSSGTVTGTNKIGVLFYPGWFASAPADSTAFVAANISTFKQALVDSQKFKDVGTALPRLSWESGACSLLANNAGIAAQQLAGRGSLTSPIVLCNKEQWRTIKNYQTLHYELADHLAVGNWTTADMPTNFSGSIQGKDKIISGFSVQVPSGGDGGLFQTLSGKLSDVHFAAGYLLGPTSVAAINVGITGTNSGTIENSAFTSVNLKGKTTKEGVVAGLNNGAITNVRVHSHIEADALAVGMLAGTNEMGKTIKGARIEGDIKNLNASSALNVGGAIGENLGTMAEVDTSVEIFNDVNNNTYSRFGVFAGLNMALIQDVLIRPWAKMKIGIGGPIYAHVIGKNGDVAVGRRIVATNEMPVPSLYSSSAANFVGEHVAGGSYEQAVSMSGAVFKFHNTARAISSCSEDGSGNFTYQTVSAFTDTTLATGYFLENYQYQLGLSARITGAHTTGTSLITSLSSQWTIPCDPAGVITGSNIYDMETSADFTTFSGVNHVMPLEFGSMSTFCPSSVSANGDLNYACPAGEFDMVEDHPNGIGFNRLINAYKSWMSSGAPPANYPVWSMSEKGYPKLFIAD